MRAKYLFLPIALAALQAGCEDLLTETPRYALDPSQVGSSHVESSREDH